jgi:NAD+ synthase (glutamine-hydrolysing)
VALACDGRLLGIVAKQHLAGDGIHYEPRWFGRWPAGGVGSIEVAGQKCPIGDLLFDCGGVRIGMEICRDAWVAERTGARLARRGADVLLNPSASHFAFAKQQIRERFVLEGSRAFCVSYAYANLLGNEAGRAIYDGGTLLASGGKMIARGPRFSFADWVLTSAVVDVAATRRARAESFSKTDDASPAAEGQAVAVEFQYPDIGRKTDEAEFLTGTCGDAKSAFGPSGATAANVPGHPAWETGSCQKEEEFARSVSLALVDYLRKSGARGLVVSLSGGVDSSSVAALVHLMVQLGGRELGLARLASRLSHVRGIEQAIGGTASGGDEAAFAEAARQTVGRLLTCVYQATQHSSQETLAAARTVAEAVGAEFLEWNRTRSVADSVGKRTIWRCRTFRPVRGAPAPGCWRICATRCC